MGINKKLVSKIFRSTIFSLIVLLVLVGGLYYIATSITDSYHKEPDFGDVVMLRQTDMGLNGSTPQNLILTRDMIFNHITSPEVLTPIAKKYGWDVSIDEMRKNIEVRERQESQRGFIIYVNTKDNKRSKEITRALAQSFLDKYKQTWKNESSKVLELCQKKIDMHEQYLKKL